MIVYQKTVGEFTVEILDETTEETESFNALISNEFDDYGVGYWRDVEIDGIEDTSYKDETETIYNLLDNYNGSLDVETIRITKTKNGEFIYI